MPPPCLIADAVEPSSQLQNSPKRKCLPLPSFPSLHRRPLHPFFFLLPLIFLSIFLPSPAHCLRQPLPVRQHSFPRRMPPTRLDLLVPPSARPQLQLIVYATISDQMMTSSDESEKKAAAEERKPKTAVKATPKSNRRHPIIQEQPQHQTSSRKVRQGQHRQTNNSSVDKRKQTRKAVNEEEAAKKEWARLVMDELLVKPDNKAKGQKDQEGETALVWQLFGLCSGAFVRISGGGNRVDAKKLQASIDGTTDDGKCQTLFLPEPVQQGDWAGRGQLLLRHVSTGRFLCLGKRRGIISRAQPSPDGRCLFREHLTSSGRVQLLSQRPLGFGPSGRPLTRRLPGHPIQRCFQFTKLESQMPVEEGKTPVCGGHRPRRARADAEQQAQLRALARNALLAQIEVGEEEDVEKTSVAESIAAGQVQIDD